MWVLPSLAVESVADGLYQWTGPNDFNQNGTDVGIEEVTVFDSGSTWFKDFGVCDIESDTVIVVVHSPCPPQSFRVIVWKVFPHRRGRHDNVQDRPQRRQSRRPILGDLEHHLGDAGVYTALQRMSCTPTSMMNVEVVTESDLNMDWTAEFEVCPGEEVVLMLPENVQASNPSIQWSC